MLPHSHRGQAAWSVARGAELFAVIPRIRRACRTPLTVSVRGLQHTLHLAAASSQFQEMNNRTMRWPPTLPSYLFLSWECSHAKQETKQCVKGHQLSCQPRNSSQDLQGVASITRNAAWRHLAPCIFLMFSTSKTRNDTCSLGLGADYGASQALDTTISGKNCKRKIAELLKLWSAFISSERNVDGVSFPPNFRISQPCTRAFNSRVAFWGSPLWLSMACIFFRTLQYLNSSEPVLFTS